MLLLGWRVRLRGEAYAKLGCAFGTRLRILPSHGMWLCVWLCVWLCGCVC